VFEVRKTSHRIHFSKGTSGREGENQRKGRRFPWQKSEGGGVKTKGLGIHNSIKGNFGGTRTRRMTLRRGKGRGEDHVTVATKIEKEKRGS